MSQESQHYWMTYPTNRVKNPMLAQMKRKFDLAFTIRNTTVTEEFGQIALELTGDQKVIKAAVRWFRRQGVQVDHLARGGVT